jgi:acyl transferase domain-containing protein/NADPH:quinone reductase-like Zn-dependent oxidoreductase/acyl carrier protein
VLRHEISAERAQIAIVGRACRLPGASSVAALWDMLSAGRCAVSTVPPDRWPLERHGHPRVTERGRSYTWAAGVLPDIWGFDPSVFGISPREAEQMDPQQRLLLELAFEACEDAGFAPSRLAGTRTGVYVGTSAADYSTIGFHDPSVADGHFATGNTLSIVANRLSYIFDLHGPSFAVDTACSASLVALHEGAQALVRDEVDAALVGGVNILAGPYGFITFSQATMLSPTGLCRAFAARADGYVRSEGGVVLVLKRLDRAVAEGDRIHGVICASGVNSDGRTNGILLPSEFHQAELLRQVYDRAEVAPDSVVYVEAHGTGTQVGDPVEASALGAALGQRRARPLPIGSVKTNIGHTEPAAGLAGLLKAMLALEHDQAPKSLHFDRPNPNIDFKRLNLVVTAEPTPLPRDGRQRFAGVSSFGFGGTNAHVVISDPPALQPRLDARPRYLMLSAQGDAALRAMAGEYARRFAETEAAEAPRIVAATAYRRERMRERLVLRADDAPALGSALTQFAESGRLAHAAARGTAVDGDGSIVFVFSGNGSQWPGMGRAAYRSNATFRNALAEIDSYFTPLAGWSLTEELASPNLTGDLALTNIAQPLIFAIQVASVRALAQVGVRPSMALGHSVGEVAAAEAAGILSLDDAVRVVHHRSRHQELTRNTGGMAVIFGQREPAYELVAEIPGLAIAGHNSPKCVVVAGPFDALDRMAKVAPTRKLRVRRLDLVYPFHTSAMEPVKQPLLESLADLAPSAGSIPFLSTIADDILPGASADALYWWRNVRESVLFQEGVERAVRLGKAIFVEVGARATLQTHLRDLIEHLDASAFVDLVLDDKSDGDDSDPFQRSAMRLLAAGATVEPSFAFGPDPGAGVELPAYPWRRATYRFSETTEATGAFRSGVRHPLIGARDHTDTLEWRTTMDPDLVPSLADHRVEGQALLPGAAFVEMGLAVAREWLGHDTAALSGFEILQPLAFAANMSREILCRVSAPTASVEIMSRPRLSKTAFVLHARGKIIQDSGSIAGVSAPVIPPGGEESQALYARALRCGFEFGPRYRQLARAVRVDASTIEVELTDETADARFGLDPARLDSCFHGLILLFEESEGAAGAYLPTRFDEVRLIKPGAQLARAMIRVKRRDARVIVADFELFDPENQLAATLYGARYQVARVRTSAAIAKSGLVKLWIPATAELNGAVSWARSLELLRGAPLDEIRLSPDVMLIEGWATAAAFELARALAVGGLVDIDALVVKGRLPRERRRWAEAVFAALEQSGLLERVGSAFRLAQIEVPRPDAVFRALAAQHPHRAAELLLAARIGAVLRDYGAATGALAGAPAGAVEAFEQRSLSAVAAAKELGARLETIAASAPRRLALRVLQIGCGAGLSETLAFAGRHSARLTIFEVDARALERARLSYGHSPETAFCGDIEALADSGFDVVVSAGGLSRIGLERGAMTRLVEKCASNAILLAVEPARSLFRDLVFGLKDGWFRDEGEALRTPEAWVSECARAGFDRADARLVGIAGESAVVLIAEAPAKAEGFRSAGEVVVLRDGADPDGFADALADALVALGAACRIVNTNEEALLKTETPRIFVLLVGQATGDAVARLSARCLAIKETALKLGSGKCQVFVPVLATDRPIAEATLGFVRTLANELQLIDFTRIEISAHSPDVARRLAALVLSGAQETDLAIEGSDVKVLRFSSPDAVPAASAESGAQASRLEKSAEGGLDRLSWQPIARKAPGAREIEVEVVATGLNFRDVMWSLSILPDEMLEDGLAGPSLGLEFSGRVARIGSAVEGLRVGDGVVGFCGGAFASHVTVDADHVAPLPPSLSCEAAASVPVAFLTAYYGLVTCANLRRGEWVLIHGGAGGVGLAALQIALWRGARAIVTAGSPEKRDLALALGAEYAFDSRSGAFVDDVMRVTSGRGVSVALNSLAGEAMERSLALLEPFGRFVELGKRDYLANTSIGLRPFRRNLSYFGVDIDQLLLARPDLSRQLFAEVLALFSSGDLTPLPYVVFPHADIVEAMRLMQQAGHIGKILVRPPPESSAIRRTTKGLSIDPNRTHLITGGLGGFGLATARWLIERGARHLVLVGRSGASTESTRSAVAQMRALGATVLVEALDIADADAADALFAGLAHSMPPLAGVVHAAMVLDDAIVANLDEARLTGVLRPKVAGAENLDRLSRGLSLDYFILFSSATTVIGNPGQSAYVAANGFLEGLARRRHEAGLPALAVAWGGIADVGVLARKNSTRDSLAARAGVQGIEAQLALDLMAEALTRAGGPGGDAFVGIAAMNWSTARAHLPLLRSPSYSRLWSDDEVRESLRQEFVDLRELAARLSPEQARRAVANIIIEEIARILRLPKEDVSRSKPLSEIGLDSLMSVELALSIEARFGMNAPVSGSSGGFNVVELAGHVLAAGVQGAQDFAVAEGLAKSHLGEADWGDVAPLMTALREKDVDLTGAPVGQSVPAK